MFLPDIPYLDLNPLFTYLNDNGYTKLVIIYKKKHIAPPVLDLLQQIESHLLSRHYDGLMQTGRVRGRNSGSNVQSSGYI